MIPTRTLNNGVEIPSLGFGTWKIPDGDAAYDAVSQALAAGYRLIDTAAVYGNERSVGRAIADSDVDRRDIFLTSKVWTTDRGYDTTLRAFDRSLKDLAVDYLDLYLIHWPAPCSRFPDWRTINAETWRALETLYDQGRVRAIGLSNFMPHHIEALLTQARIAPMVDQIEFHPGFMQRACLDACADAGIVVEGWSPLGSGRMLDNPELAAIAARYGVSIARLCLRWAWQHGVVALPRTVNPDRIRQNLDIFDFRITPADMAAIDAMPYIGGSGHDPDTVTF